MNRYYPCFPVYVDALIGNGVERRIRRFLVPKRFIEACFRFRFRHPFTHQLELFGKRETLARVCSADGAPPHGASARVGRGNRVRYPAFGDQPSRVG
jgi:hypothetical protein